MHVRFTESLKVCGNHHLELLGSRANPITASLELLVFTMNSVISHSITTKELRKKLRTRRNALTEAQQKLASKNLYKQLVNSHLFKRSKHIALYLANDGEIDPYLLIRIAKKHKKKIYLPVLKRWPKHAMIFQQITPNTAWRINHYKIKEPVYNKQQEAHPLQLDLVLMPLVGFDDKGGRLGMGGGFYDRYFNYLKRMNSWHKPYLLGLAHECQRVEKLQLNHWDIKAMAVVTDKQWYVH